MDEEGGGQWSQGNHNPKSLYDHSTESSIREDKGRSAEAAAAAARCERVVITKHGRPFIELVLARARVGMDFAKAAQVRKELGIDDVKVSLSPDFDDPAVSRDLLELQD